jgi:hypothetical protein
MLLKFEICYFAIRLRGNDSANRADLLFADLIFADLRCRQLLLDVLDDL